MTSGKKPTVYDEANEIEQKFLNVDKKPFQAEFRLKIRRLITFGNEAEDNATRNIETIKASQKEPSARGMGTGVAGAISRAYAEQHIAKEEAKRDRILKRVNPLIEALINRMDFLYADPAFQFQFALNLCRLDYTDKKYLDCIIDYMLANNSMGNEQNEKMFQNKKLKHDIVDRIIQREYQDKVIGNESGLLYKQLNHQRSPLGKMKVRMFGDNAIITESIKRLKEVSEERIKAQREEALREVGGYKKL